MPRPLIVPSTLDFVRFLHRNEMTAKGIIMWQPKRPGYRHILVSLVVFISFSCQSTIIDQYNEEELIRIMLDAHTLGLIYNRQEIRTDSLKLAYYDVLEERYGLTREGFQELVEGLILNSELYDKVYEEMTEKVDKMEKMDMEEPYNSR